MVNVLKKTEKVGFNKFCSMETFFFVELVLIFSSNFIYSEEHSVKLLSWIIFLIN